MVRDVWISLGPAFFLRPWTVVIISLAVCICASAKLDEVRLSRLTVAGWLLLIVTVIVTVMVSFVIGGRLYDVLTYESGRVA